MAAESCIANSRYTYVHEDEKNGPLEAIDVHNVLLLRKTNSKLLLTFIFALLLTTTAFSLSSLKQGESNNMLLWSLLLSATLVIIFLGKRVEKESVIIMPAFGVQLETHYGRGRTIHRFIPMDKILKPVLSECVTPVTCYWSLSLLVRDEEELLLVFKELHPPVKILISVWKALCTATDSSETLDQPG